MKKILVTALTLGTLAVSAHAERNLNTGCGLGSMIIDNQNTVAKQVVAATLNSLSGNQTFGITTGTMGCEKPTLLVSREVEVFVADNMDDLATDIAMGEGERLDTLAAMLGVKDKAAFGAKLKANFDKIYASADVTSAKVIDRIVTIAG
ncbi:MAG TPA: DUF3015 domain-containing protein [Campylobacteraceae bacterium]|nr:DUF3015 domain-containing protein [Campylobacteraceae bacterium]